MYAQSRITLHKTNESFSFVPLQNFDISSILKISARYPRRGVTVYVIWQQSKAGPSYFKRGPFLRHYKSIDFTIKVCLEEDEFIICHL